MPQHITRLVLRFLVKLLLLTTSILALSQEPYPYSTPSLYQFNSATPRTTVSTTHTPQTPAQPTSSYPSSPTSFMQTFSNIPSDIAASMQPAYSHLPNVSYLFLPMRVDDIIQVSLFCRKRPPGSYCYFAPNSTGCWSGTIVDCPSGILSYCKAGYVCTVGKNQSTSPLQFAAASCIAPLPQPTIPISVNNGPVLRLDGLVIMCSDPVELPTIVTRIIRCTYFRTSPTSTLIPTSPLTTTCSPQSNQSTSITFPSVSLSTTTTTLPFIPFAPHSEP